MYPQDKLFEYSAFVIIVLSLVIILWSVAMYTIVLTIISINRTVSQILIDIRRSNKLLEYLSKLQYSQIDKSKVDLYPGKSD